MMMNVLANHPKMANTFGLVTVGIFDIPSYPNSVGYSLMKYSRLQGASMVFAMAMFLLFVLFLFGGSVGYNWPYNGRGFA
jgi:hypothetical protein